MVHQINGEEASHNDALQDSNASEERIYVSVRLRPLNEKELTSNDPSDWECINSTTILFKNGLGERSVYPTAYTFDRVFDTDCNTRQVYDEAAKRIAVSVVSGINSSIFAYGQTSSGKTYTMSGITEYAVADIYDYINKNHSRQFVLKFSALEIYNEAVRDLLCADNTPLRLLDDPERGTVIEKLSEVRLRDWSHLKELLAVCAAQRKIGETSLNEMSSRSHQILRLTVESSAREFRGSGNSSTLAASVHFVDLAGSERASQTMSVGTRLKEGSHINRSLLTLGTVIRKLSKGRNGHIPYRDSKLTRILQNSLGGNARTAIICTMSPAHSHVEQSRNTLLFASCAKQVSTNAQVNVVMSEKALVKQLQKEIARLESQLKSLGSLTTSFDSLALQEKELLIEKMQKEIGELANQRDESQSRLESILRSAHVVNQIPRPWDEFSTMSGSHSKGSWTDEHSVSETSEMCDPFRPDMASYVPQFSDRDEGLNFSKYTEQLPELSEERFLSDDISPRMFIEKYFGPDPTKGWEKLSQTDPNSEDNCKEVRCIEIVSDSNIENSNPVSLPEEEDRGIVEAEKEQNYDATFDPTKEYEERTYPLIQSHPSGQFSSSSDSESSDTGSIEMSRSKSCVNIMETVPLSPKSTDLKEDMNLLPDEFETGSVVDQEVNVPEEDDEQPPLKTCKESFGRKSVDKIQHVLQTSGQDEVPQIESDEPQSDDLSAKDIQVSEKPQKNSNEQENEVIDSEQAQTKSDWSVEFEKQRMDIIELWDSCDVPLVHRSYFFLVFKGDPSDSIYMEVELRRLSFLKTTQRSKQEASRAINRERSMFSKLMLKKLSTKEREALFEKWGIDLKTKQRRHQLSRLLWTKTKDMEHIKESADLVAKLVGFPEQSQAPKEMVGLSFSTPSLKLKPFSWKPSMSPLV